MHQHEFENESNDEIDLSEIFRTILKYKGVVIGITLVVTATVFLINLIRPKIYEGRIIVRIVAPAYVTNNSVISAKELKECIGNITLINEQIFKKTYGSVQKVDIKEVKGTENFIQIIVQSKNRDKLQDSVDELLNYIWNVKEVRAIQDRVHNELNQQISETKKSLKDSEEILGIINTAIKGNMKVIGFDPIESNQRVNTSRIKLHLFENEIATYKIIRTVSEPRISKDPVEPKIILNTTIAFLSAIFFSALIAVLYGIKKR